MKRTVIGVITSYPEQGFIEPTSAEEAVERKARLQDEIEVIQESLSDKDLRGPAGARLPFDEWNTWRRETIHMLHQKQRELRRLKAWAGMHKGDAKVSEWSLLRKAYHVLVRLDAGGYLDRAPQVSKEVDALLDDIECTIPDAYLQKGAMEEPLAHTG